MLHRNIPSTPRTWSRQRARRLARAGLAAIALLLLLGPLAPATAQKAPQTDARQTLTDMHDRWVRAVQTENLGELSNLYLDTKALRQIPARQALRLEGWRAVRRSFDRLFASTESLHLEVFHRDVAIFGASGIVSAYIEVTAAAGDQSLQYLVRQTQVYQKMQGGWKLVHEHLSEAAR